METTRRFSPLFKPDAVTCFEVKGCWLHAAGTFVTGCDVITLNSAARSEPCQCQSKTHIQRFCSLAARALQPSAVNEEEKCSMCMLVACFALHCGHIGCLCSACLSYLHLIITNKHDDMILLCLCLKSDKAGGRERKEERPSSVVCFLFMPSYSAHSLKCRRKSLATHAPTCERIQCSQPVSATHTAAVNAAWPEFMRKQKWNCDLFFFFF